LKREFCGFCKGNKYIDRIDTGKTAIGYTNGSSCRLRKRCW